MTLINFIPNPRALPNPNYTLSMFAWSWLLPNFDWKGPFPLRRFEMEPSLLYLLIRTSRSWIKLVLYLRVLRKPSHSQKLCISSALGTAAVFWRLSDWLTLALHDETVLVRTTTRPLADKQLYHLTSCCKHSRVSYPTEATHCQLENEFYNSCLSFQTPEEINFMRRDMFCQLLERGGPELKEKLEQSEAEAMEKAKDKGTSFNMFFFFFNIISTDTSLYYFCSYQLIYSRSWFSRRGPRVRVHQKLWPQPFARHWENRREIYSRVAGCYGRVVRDRYDGGHARGLPEALPPRGKLLSFTLISSYKAKIQLLNNMFNLFSDNIPVQTFYGLWSSSYPRPWTCIRTDGSGACLHPYKWSHRHFKAGF